MTAGSFEGLVAVVTGGASGIGQAVVATLSERGAAVASLDRSYPGTSPATDRASGLDVVGDVSDGDQVDRAIAEVADHYGRIDVVVNNAGIGAQGSIEVRADVEWHALYDVNVLGIVRVTRAAMTHLRRSEHPSVVNVGSIAGWAGLPERAAYSASKGAVHALTLAMAADALSEGIRVNAVAPGTADTPWVQRLLDQADDRAAERLALIARQPFGRLITPQEVADAVCYLASPAAGSVTGTILAVDGGMAGLRPRPKN
ncbi:MAG: SDR family oxidoreductase [Actinomycetota bacterium]